MSEIEETLRELIEPYKYGKFDLLDRMDELTVFKSGSSITVDNWLDYTPDVVTGNCNELSTKVYAKIPGMNKRLVRGYDGEIFTKHTARHCYVLVSDNDGQDIVVDPSLQFVGPLAESSYSVLEYIDEHDIGLKLARGRFSLQLHNYRSGSVIGLGDNQIYFIGQNTAETDDVFSVYRLFCLPGEVDSMFANRAQELSVTALDNPVFDLAYRLNELGKRSL